MSKKVLIITYYWPPSGGPGVQRVLKFVKYLSEFGWEPIILTVKNGEYPAIDETLLKDIPKNCKVYKTKSIEPNSLYKKFTGMKPGENIPVANLAKKNTGWKKKISNLIRLSLFIPDAKIGWIRYAIKEGKKIILEEKPNIIFSSSPPPTVHLIAKKLAKWSGIKWVADFRDPWTKIHYLQNQKINPISRRINKNFEKKVIEKCESATCVSENFVNLLTNQYNSKFKIITNGFDTEFNTPVKNNSEKYTILYIGGLTWNRYYPDFFRSVANFIKQKKADNIELQFVGSIEPSILTEIKEKLKNIQNIKFVDYVPHCKALEYMHKADLLLLFLEKAEGYEGHIPGKLFEYLSTGNRILGIGNIKGESARILSETKAGKIFETQDTHEIEKEIIQQYTNWEKQIQPETDMEKVNQFTRKKLTEKLAGLFDELV